MTTTTKQPSPKPTRKVAAGGLGGAAALIIIAGLNHLFGVEIQGELAAAITTVVAFGVAWLVPEAASKNSDPTARPWGRSMAVLALAGVLTSCTPPSNYIRSEAVDGPFRGVADRHDAYVNADESLDDLERRIYLRDTELLRRLLDEAVPAAAEPQR